MPLNWSLLRSSYQQFTILNCVFNKVPQEFFRHQVYNQNNYIVIDKHIYTGVFQTGTIYFTFEYNKWNNINTITEGTLQFKKGNGFVERLLPYQPKYWNQQSVKKYRVNFCGLVSRPWHFFGIICIDNMCVQELSYKENGKSFYNIGLLIYSLIFFAMTIITKNTIMYASHWQFLRK